MKKLMLNKVTLVSSLTVFLAGCGYSQTLQNSSPQTLPSTYGALADEQSVTVVETPERNWWKQFNMPELNQLLAEMNDGNFDLAIARQRIARSQALLGQQQANNLPRINGNISGTRTTTENGARSNNEMASLGFNASYEVDLWGTRSAANKAAELNISVEQTRLRSTALTLQAQVATLYFDLLSLKGRIAATQQNLNAGEGILKLVKTRFDAGRTSSIELEQQRNILFEQKSLLLSLKRDLTITERALAALLGRDTLQLAPIDSRLNDANIPIVSIIQPAHLLQSRPDIVMAEAELHISNLNLYQSKRKRWPTLNLTADATLSEILTNDPLWGTSLIGQLAAPLFDGGRIKQEIAASEAASEIALQTYQKTVMKALEETLNTLTQLNHQRDINVVREAELKTAEKLFDLAKKRFDAGNIDFLNMLDAQRNLFTTSERALSAKRDHLVATINTFKAMGIAPHLARASS